MPRHTCAVVVLCAALVALLPGNARGDGPTSAAFDTPVAAALLLSCASMIALHPACLLALTAGAAAPARVAAPAPRTTPRAAAIDPDKVGEIERPWAREAFTAWRARRSAELPGASISHRVDDIFRCGNCEDLLITERVVEGERCRETHHVLNISADASEPARLDARAIATDCCPGAPCPGRTPAAWLLVLDRVLKTRDHERLRRLIAPDDGLAVSSWFRDGGRARSRRVSRKGPLGAVFTTIQRVQPLHDTIECDATFTNGVAACAVHGGGFQADYRWRTEGERVYLLEVSQESH